jgi:integrase
VNRLAPPEDRSLWYKPTLAVVRNVRTCAASRRPAFRGGVKGQATSGSSRKGESTDAQHSPTVWPPSTARHGRRGLAVPAAVAGAGDTAVRRFLEFFAASIRNKNTRMAYYRAVTDFFAWLDAAGIVALVDIEPLHVATYIEALQERMAKPTVKQHLAAIRMLFDWLVTGGILASNPATSVRGPKHVIKRGKTPVLTTDQARVLIESIDTSTLVGLRDRALIGVMTYAFARIGAVVSMRVEDYFANGKRWWVRLHEKGGKRHEMPAHHKLEAFLDEYLRAADVVGDAKRPPVPLRDRPHRRARGYRHAPCRRLAHDPAPLGRSRHEGQDRLPHLPGHRDHGLP